MFRITSNLFDSVENFIKCFKLKFLHTAALKVTHLANVSSSCFYFGCLLENLYMFSLKQDFSRTLFKDTPPKKPIQTRLVSSHRPLQATSTMFFANLAGSEYKQCTFLWLGLNLQEVVSSDNITLLELLPMSSDVECPCLVCTLRYTQPVLGD